MAMPPPPESSLAIPSGPAAVAAWKDLDRGVRKRLLAGQPAPDGMTALVAVGYARNILSQPQWRYIVLRLGIYIPAMFVLVFLNVELFHSTSQLPNLIGFAILFGFFLYWRRRHSALLAMEVANAALLWPVNAPLPAVHLPHHDLPPLTVRYRTSAIIWPWLFLLIVWSGTIAAAFSTPAAAILPGLIAVIFTWLMGRAVIIGVRPGGVALQLTPEGLSVVALRITVPWSDITEIRLVPAQQQSFYGYGRRRVQLALVTADPQGILTKVKGLAATGVKASMKAYGTPLSISDRSFDHSVHDIAAAASRFSGAPLRAYGQRVH